MARRTACAAMDAPRFRCYQGDPELRYTEEAGRLVKNPPSSWTCLQPQEVKKNAERELTEMGGDGKNRLAVLGCYRLQLGVFRGNTFKWLLENALGYGAYISYQVQRENKSFSPLYIHKMAIYQYMKAFPEGRRAIEMKTLKEENKVRPKPKIPTTKDRQPTAITPRQERPSPVPVFSKAQPTSTPREGEPKAAPSKRKPAVITTPPQPEKRLRTEEKAVLEDTCVTDADLLAAAEGIECMNEDQGIPSTSHPFGVVDDVHDRECVLTEGWKKTLPKADHQWISRKFFKLSSKGKAEIDNTRITDLWYYPPQPKFAHGQPPKPSRYFATKILMWMPRRLWAVKLVCPHDECSGQELTSAGTYPSVRQVVDVDGCYNMAGEYLECRRCHRKVISWSQPILCQLDIGHRMQFPAILTYKLACDIKIVSMLRDRSFGNGPFQMMKKVKEAHTEAWLRKVAIYQSAVQQFITASKKGLIERPTCEAPPPMTSLPTYQWLLSIYCNDVLTRIDEVKAGITSTFGRILKMDSTKKITRKLAGQYAGTASWATNVGNELGQVLMSVMTAAEGMGLNAMTQGIVRRYQAAGQPTPELLYVDRDCCGASSLIFKEWPELTVRLDIWHFMRRLTRGCTTDMHQLYPFFMQQLSKAIFVWSAGDVEQLVRAKRAELAAQNIHCLSDDDIMKRIGRKEMARHCRRVTRGTAETKQRIGDLLASLDGEAGKDTLGVPLFDSEKIWSIWDSQEKHVACIQDVPGVQLYTQTGGMVKGGITLPVFRCARGSTSLESFHLHLNHFIPGTSANNNHFQAYLLEGVHRWNCDRAAAASGMERPSHTSYASANEFKVNQKNKELFGEAINPSLVAPLHYTGELIGMDYLNSQNNQDLLPMIPDEDEGDDEGVDVGCREDESLEDPTQPPPEVPARPASSRQSLAASRTQPATTSMARAPSVPVMTPTKQRRTKSSRAPATVSRAPDSPPIASRVERTALRAPSTVSRSPDSAPPSTSTTTTTIPKAPSTVSRAPASMMVREDLLVRDEVKDLDDVPLLSDPESEHEAEEFPGPKNILGYDRIQALAAYLIKFKEDTTIVSKRQAEEIITLWEALDQYDKTIKRPAHHQEKLTKGRFKSTGAKPTAPGVESTKRSFLGSNTGPASWPDANRVMECVISKLCAIIPDMKKERGKCFPRWGLIIRAYKSIRTNIISNALITSKTQLQLMEINQRTLIEWFNKKSKLEERTTLEMGISLPSAPMTTTQQLPAPVALKDAMPVLPKKKMVIFSDVPNTAGQATIGKRPSSQPIITVTVLPPPPQRQDVQTPRRILPAGLLQQPRNIPAPSVFSSRSSKAYWKHREEEKKQGIVRKTYTPRKGPITCKKCNGARDSQNHTQHFGFWYCKRTPQKQTLEEWKEEVSEHIKEKREQKKKKD